MNSYNIIYCEYAVVGFKFLGVKNAIVNAKNLKQAEEFFLRDTLPDIKIRVVRNTILREFGGGK